MADAPDAPEGAKKAEAEVPEELTLLHFCGREELSDCSIKLPKSGALQEQAVKCHRLALCSCSGYCFRHFLKPDAESELALPELPEDAELRRQLPLHGLFQLVLRFAYANQTFSVLESEAPEMFPGLYALAMLLEAKKLAEATYEAMELRPGAAAKLLYVASQLEGQADFQTATARCLEVLRQNFGELCSGFGADFGLLAKLPVKLLVTLLEEDDLNVPTEETCLRFVRHVLWRRLPRPEKMLTLSGTLDGAAEGVQLMWESVALEETSSTSPPVDRYSASAQSEGGAIPELSHRVPDPKGGKGALLLRALRGEEVYLSVELPIRWEEASPDEMQVQALQDGKPVTIRFRYTLNEAPEDAKEDGDGEKDAEGGEKKDGEGEAKAEKTRPDMLLKKEEVEQLLGGLRFGHLDHPQLLEAVKDPLLSQAGAQSHLTDALSVRLARYEAADAAAPPRPARPSTRGGSRDGAAGGAAGSSAPVGAAGAATPAPPPDAPEPGSPQFQSSRGTMGANLFPCRCGEGRMQLRQAEGRFLARCHRMASCQEAIWLPSSVVAAAVDGHCAACALRLGAEVRTLTVRLGRDQCRVLRKLPSGVDTLRGMCIAGCHDLLSLLG
ncbi:unnamed protein product [Durusdinium trenchii]|uniref:Uncharacterized protein n=2 Tax=Durusdinium trenchii TaxID=1381693 RepID=A0ABP0MS37_9DINO